MNNINTKQPAGLWLICVTEAFERFSYYAMRALLILYFVYALKMDKGAASNLYGSFTGLVYLSGIYGGYIADRITGQKGAIIAGALMIIVGQFLLGFESVGMIYTALGFLVMGNGFFKISVSTLVGSLYEKGDARRDSGFTYFYMSVNIGAFLAAIIGGGIGEKLGWRYGFWTAAFAMVIGLVIFLWGKEKYLKGRGDKPATVSPKAIKEAVTVTALLAAAVVLVYFLGIWKTVAVGFAAALIWFLVKNLGKKPAGASDKKPLTTEEKQRIAVIFILAFFVIFFWTAFEQQGAALNLFAYEQTDRWINFFGLFHWEIPATWFQSLNPVYVVLFAPLFSKLWVDLAKKGKEPSTPAKFVVALWLIGAGFAVLLFGAMQLGPGVKLSMLYLFAAYALLTMGELCLSPVGLSMVTKLAPVQFVGLLMGVWKTANAASNKLAGFYSSYLGKISNEAFFSGLIIGPIAASLILLALMPKIKKWMHGVN